MFYCYYNVEDLKSKSVWPAVAVVPTVGLDKIMELVPNCLLKLNHNDIHILPIKTIFSFYSCFDLKAALQKRYRLIINHQEFNGELCRLCLNKYEKIIGQCNTYNFGLDHSGYYDLREFLSFLKDHLNYVEVKPGNCLKSSYLKQIAYKDKQDVYHPNMLSVGGLSY